MKYLLLFLAIGTIYGQTVSGQTTGGTPLPQNLTAVISVVKVQKAAMSLTCPKVPLCAALTAPATACINAAGALMVLAGTTCPCVYNLTNATAGAGGMTVNNTTSDATTITVDPTATFAAGNAVSGPFNIGATP